jgi:precorrin-2 dehydrogenase/sirohydrochlorin ferrochelatase
MPATPILLSKQYCYGSIAMKTFPIMLRLDGRLAVVVGGGPVGLRKARSLREAGARVRVVAPQIAGEGDLDGIELLREEYAPRHLKGSTLVMACTDEAAVNRRIAQDARAAGALVNAADQPEDCDFYLPATVNEGSIVVAVGTGGDSPALARRLKEAVSAALPPRIGEFAGALSRLREELKDRIPDSPARGEIMKRLSGEETYRLFLRGGEEAVRQELDKLLDSRK